MSRALVTRAAFILAFLAVGGASHAGRIAIPPNAPAAHAQECGACHTAYPPGLLPAANWARIMSALEKHFGTNAALDDNTAAELSRYLQSNAGTYKRAVVTADSRITSATWFDRKHRKVGAATWALKSVGGRSNCTACHAGAAQGDFSERDVVVPK